MLDNLKYIMCTKSIDKHIADCEYDSALKKLNFLIKEDFKPAQTYLKRGKLCKKLLMIDDAYSDFTYVIAHCSDKDEAYNERVHLNFEIANYYEAIRDANYLLDLNEDNWDIKRVKFLSLLLSGQDDLAKTYVLNLFENDKYKAIQFLFKETALLIATDEFSRGLKVLEVIELIDSNNPIKILKEANIYDMVNQPEKAKILLKKIDDVFPKYFINHFNYWDMYQDKDIMEISFLLELSIFDKQNLFAYQMKILEGYKQHMESHIISSKECFEQAIELNPTKPEAYVLLAQTLQLMSGYDSPEYRQEAEKNYKIAMEIYHKMQFFEKVEEMKRQIRHLNSTLPF